MSDSSVSLCVHIANVVCLMGHVYVAALKNVNLYFVLCERRHHALVLFVCKPEHNLPAVDFTL